MTGTERILQQYLLELLWLGNIAQDFRFLNLGKELKVKKAQFQLFTDFIQLSVADVYMLEEPIALTQESVNT